MINCRLMSVVLLAAFVAACTNPHSDDASNSPNAKTSDASRAQEVSFDDPPRTGHDGKRVPSIHYKVSSWGRPVDVIELREDGIVLRRNFEFMSEKLTSESEFLLPHQDQLNAVGSLQAIRRLEGKRIYCDNYPTDGPYGEIRWNEGATLHIYMPCLSNPENLAVKSAIDAFVAKVSAAEIAHKQK